MARPIYIVGAGRSGTSLLTWAVGQHPNIFVSPETPWLSALLGYVGGIHRIGMSQSGGHFALWDVSEVKFKEILGDGISQMMQRTFREKLPELASELGASGLRWARGLNEPKFRWVDATPSHSGYELILGAMFPEARFINLVRNPDSVIRSYLTFEGRSISNPIEATQWIYNTQRSGYYAHAAFEDRSIRVILEQLLADPEAEMRRIYSFLDEDYCAHCLYAFEDKVNPSTLPPNADELAIALGSSEAKQMRDWYSKAISDPDWRLDSESESIRTLKIFEKFKIPMPA